MQNEHRLIARWKDILLYLDTYHLILHIGISNKKVGRGGKRRKEPWEKCTKNFYFRQGHSGGARNFCHSHSFVWSWVRVFAEFAP